LGDNFYISTVVYQLYDHKKTTIFKLKTEYIIVRTK